MKYLLTFATLMMTACLDTEKEDSDDEDEEEEETSSFTPSEGLWLVDVTITEDSCGFFSGEEGGMDTAEESADEMTLTNTGDGSFSVTMDGGTDENGQEMEDYVFTCSLLGKSFTCDPSTNSFEITPDSIISQSMNFSGSFSSAIVFSGNTQIDVSCEGTDCAGLADFGFELPCSASGEAEGSFVE